MGTSPPLWPGKKLSQFSAWFSSIRFGRISTGMWLSRGREIEPLRSPRNHVSADVIPLLLSQPIRKTNVSLATKLNSEQLPIAIRLASRYSSCARSIRTFITRRFPTIENSPVAALNLKKRNILLPQPVRSAQVNLSCQQKLWIMAVSTANAVAIRYSTCSLLRSSQSTTI
jgi:hypothetical protein